MLLRLWRSLVLMAVMATVLLMAQSFAVPPTRAGSESSALHPVDADSSGHVSVVIQAAVQPAVGDCINLEAVNYPGWFIRHLQGLGEIAQLSSNQDFLDATFIMRHALDGTSGAVTLESTNYPGYFFRHQFGRVKLDQDDGSDLMHADASFLVQGGLAGTSAPDGTLAVSFESINYPDYYIRHYNAHLWVERNDGTPIFQEDASFSYRKVEAGRC